MLRVEPQQQFAANLRRIRESKKISQEALGHLADLHRTEVSLLERGRRDPQLKTMTKLARALDVTVARLVRGIK